MLVPIRISTNMADENQQKYICYRVLLQKSKELINIKVILFLYCKIPQNNSLFYTYPGTDSLSLSLCLDLFGLFAASRKSLEIQEDSITKPRTLLKGKYV